MINKDAPYPLYQQVKELLKKKSFLARGKKDISFQQKKNLVNFMTYRQLR